MSGDLDPADWEGFRAEARAALDGMVDHLRTLRERPAWTEPTPAVRAAFAGSAPPEAGRPLGAVLADVQGLVFPHATGNLHPGFMGWVHGAGTPAGMVAAMLAGGLNLNCGGRNHVGLDVERQVTRWMAAALGFPGNASGVFTTGTSQANFMGLLVARTAALGPAVRRAGLGTARLTLYASAGAHGCIAQAAEMAGIGSDGLRPVPVDGAGAMRPDALAGLVAADREAGHRPFLVVGTAGTVDTGAVDPLAALAELSAREGLWFHVDGAFGALAAFAPGLRPMLAGLERADSVAFDFHKWGHVPYDAGFLLVRDAEAHRRTFGSRNGYLSRAETGLAAGGVWPCDLGPDLSRGFRALTTWITLQHYGTARIGAVIEERCALARRLAATMAASPRFAVLAPVALNIVCLSARVADPDRTNRAIVEWLHADGRVLPSVTTLGGTAAIRCAVNNHRTTAADIDALPPVLDEALAAVTA